MTAPPRISAIRLHKQLDAIWRTPHGIGRLSAVNHTIIGRRFLVTAFLFFAIGGILGMLIRAQLATPRSAFLGPDIYNQVFTMHGTVMMFLFAIPLFEGLAMYLLPKMLGARDMAFPRLSAYGYWCYLFGGSILIAGLLLGVAPDGGWFMYTPLSSRTYTPGINADVWLIGVTFVEISALSAAIEIIVTVLKLRAPGMSLDRMPLFAWYLLITAFMMLFGFPPLIIGSILLEVERAFDLPFFDPTRGGDPLLWQHLFWLFGHPEVYIIFLPAAGAVSTILPVLARREIIGYTWIVVSVIAMAFLSFGLWVHHMFTVGIPHLALAFFSAASTAVAVPTAVQIFAWIGTLFAGRPQLKLPMLFLLGFFFVFAAGGLTGVMLAVVPFNWQAHDTHFVVAHLHYVLVGGFIFPMLAAAYYWLPHFTGRESRLSFGTSAFWLIFIGFNLTFLVMHLTGLLGMTRRIYTYEANFGWEWLNLISSFGAFIMAIGFAAFLIDVILHIKFGKRTAANPWQAPTLEWAMPLPAASYNFASIPRVSSRENTPDARATGLQLAKGEGYLGFARNMAQETLGVETTSGKIEYVIRLPRATYLPIITAAATGLFFISVLFKLYTLAIAGFVLTIVMLLAWTRTVGLRQDVGPVAIGNGETAINHAEAPNPPSVWASGLAIAADATAFSSLAFGLLFLWVVAPNWPPPRLLDPDFTIFLTIVAGSIFAATCARLALHQSNAGQSGQREVWLAASALGQVIAGGALIACLLAIPDPVRHAYAATSFMLVAYMLLRAGFALLLTLFAFWRSRTGYVSVTRTMDLRICSMWQAHAAVTAAVGAGLVFGLPWTLIP